MYKVYILYSRLYDKTYVGFSSDVDQRLISHNLPQNKGYTKRFQPWNLVYTEPYETKAQAMEREKHFKTGRGREEIQAILSRLNLR
ncbi:MAG: GIY-YIG nuclease family protein [Bacteroidetes bacterium]|nr:GIY-YIG nuclease family protein [Bacteroidota bacterium]